MSPKVAEKYEKNFDFDELWRKFRFFFLASANNWFFHFVSKIRSNLYGIVGNFVDAAGNSILRGKSLLTLER